MQDFLEDALRLSKSLELTEAFKRADELRAMIERGSGSSIAEALRNAESAKNAITVLSLRHHDAVHALASSIRLGDEVDRARRIIEAGAITTDLHASWTPHLELLESVKSSLMPKELAVSTSALLLAEELKRAQERLSIFNRTGLGANQYLSQREKHALIGTATSLTSSYSALLDEFASRSIISLPDCVSHYPPIEVSRHVSVLECIARPVEADTDQPREDDEAQIPLDELLERVDRALVEMWDGARHAGASSGPDHSRHAFVSLRELVTHLLHLLAPDNEVSRWSREPQHYHNNRPTRAARLLYICRGVGDRAFEKFVQADVKAAIDLIECLNADTHALSPEQARRYVRVILLRTAELVRFLISIHFEGS